MVVKSLPMADGSGYVANITGMGFSFAKAENLNAVYKLLRYLMDYEFSIPYGFSVNRANTEKQFEIAEKRVMKSYLINSMRFMLRMSRFRRRSCIYHL